MSFLGPFNHTTGTTWGGSQISPTVLKLITVLGGFLGLDHLLLRSPKTAIAKFLVNLFTLGFWYFYDIVQVFSDLDFIKQFGYTIPGLGPVGLGAGMIHSDNGQGQAPATSPNPFYYLGYALMIAIPFGFSHFLAGDYYGGAAKFFLSYIIFTFLLGWVWAAYSTLHLVMNTPDILEKGTDRMFPVTLFMNDHGPAPNLMIPKTTPTESNVNSWLDILTTIFPFLKPIEKKVLETVVSTGDSVTSAASFVKSTAENVDKTAPAVAEVLQKGGGFSISENMSGPIFFGITGIIFIGALITTYLRFQGVKQNKTIDYKHKNDIPPEISDEPPSGSRAL